MLSEWEGDYATRGESGRTCPNAGRIGESVALYQALIKARKSSITGEDRLTTEEADDPGDEDRAA